MLLFQSSKFQDLAIRLWGGLKRTVMAMGIGRLILRWQKNLQSVIS